MCDKKILTKIGGKVSSLYFAEDCVDAWYDHENHLMVITWYNLSTNLHYRKSYLSLLDAAKKYQPRALIVDTRRTFGVAYPEEVFDAESHNGVVFH